MGDQIDDEVRRVLEEGMGRAREVLKGRRGVVEEMVRQLLVEEQLDGDVLREILEAAA